MKKSNKWSFQLLPNTPNVLGKGFRVDTTTQAIEDEVNAALPYYFKFHKISKLVIRLGPKEGERDYQEHIGVAQKYYPDFDILDYASLDSSAKIKAMRRIILDVFDWLITNFEDADCFKIATEKLNWSEQVAGNPDIVRS
ncbi:MAG TPA: hypothetical protein PLA50_07095 [Bacteroidia bacterium]|nr:hypothetical protein [Bacteroidia bacterium]